MDPRVKPEDDTNGRVRATVAPPPPYRFFPSQASALAIESAVAAAR